MARVLALATAHAEREWEALKNGQALPKEMEDLNEKVKWAAAEEEMQEALNNPVVAARNASIQDGAMNVESRGG